MKRKIVLMMILAAAMASAWADMGSVEVAGEVTTVMPASSKRTWFIIQNTGSDTAWIRFDGGTNALTTDNGIKLAGGATLAVSREVLLQAARNKVEAISDGDTTLTFQEGQ